MKYFYDMVKGGVYMLTAVFMVMLASTGYGQSAQEVIAHHVEAIGGEEHWKGLRFLRVETKEVIGKRISLHSRTLITHKIGARIEGTHGKNKTTYIINQHGGWSSLPLNSGYAPIDDAQYEGMRRMLDLQPVFVDYVKKGHSFVLKKRKKRVHKRRCYVIEGMLEGTHKATYYFDVENYRLLKEELKYGKRLQTITYEDYRAVKGYLFSFKQEMGGGGFDSERITVSIAVNEHIDSASFDVKK